MSEFTLPEGCRWIILGPDETKRRGTVRVRCSCPAATEKSVWKYDIRDGNSLSCGCHRKEKLTKHGRKSTDSTYSSWNNMMNRCNNPAATGYDLYGGRGIKVCERWREFNNFLEDMGERPDRNHTLDRYPDPDGNYEKSNCRWASKKDQARNMRSNVNLTHGGKTQCLSAWAEELGIDRTVLETRVRLGWNDTRTLTTPVEHRRPRNAKGGSVLTFEGKTQRVKEWAEELNIPVTTIYSRLALGWSVERVLGPYSRQYDDTPTIPLAPPPPAG